MPYQATLQIADQLVSRRLGYDHHGIYIGDGCVVHYSGSHSLMHKGAIEITSLDHFTAGNSLYVANFAQRKFSRDEIRERALSRLGEDKYHLIFNNCEHFSNWCVSGEHQSEQVQYACQQITLCLVSPTLVSQLKPQSERFLLNYAGTTTGLITNLALPVAIPATPEFPQLRPTVLFDSAPLGAAALPVTAAVALGAVATYALTNLWDWFWDE